MSCGKTCGLQACRPPLPTPWDLPSSRASLLALPMSPSRSRGTATTSVHSRLHRRWLALLGWTCSTVGCGGPSLQLLRQPLQPLRQHPHRRRAPVLATRQTRPRGTILWQGCRACTCTLPPPWSASSSSRRLHSAFGVGASGGTAAIRVHYHGTLILTLRTIPRTILRLVVPVTKLRLCLGKPGRGPHRTGVQRCTAERRRRR
mmetsp:Transcript_17118/g.44577  ORF Transcript_17118/g.44577 Transcript_17118/m.44577 type:complete len:203 (+) Transcript_17118:841-1449(+)